MLLCVTWYSPGRLRTTEDQMRTCKCGTEVAKSHRFCSTCGLQFGNRSAAKSLLILLAVIIVGSILSTVGVPKLSPALWAALQKQEATQEKEEQAQQKTEADNDAKVLAASIGARTLREDMRNPDSFKLVQVLIMKDNTVCYEYRAQNGFGGMNIGDAVLSPNGTMKTSEEPGFTPLWNKRCLNKIGKDATQEVGAADDIGTYSY